MSRWQLTPQQRDAMRTADEGVRGPHKSYMTNEWTVYVPANYEEPNINAEQIRCESYTKAQKRLKVERVLAAVSLLCPFLGPFERGEMREAMATEAYAKKQVPQLIREFTKEYAE